MTTARHLPSHHCTPYPEVTRSPIPRRTALPTSTPARSAALGIGVIGSAAPDAELAANVSQALSRCAVRPSVGRRGRQQARATAPLIEIAATALGFTQLLADAMACRDGSLIVRRPRRHRASCWPRWAPAGRPAACPPTINPKSTSASAPVTLTSPATTGVGDRPTFSWDAVNGAANYSLAVLSSDDIPLWAWLGTTTDVILGGWSEPPPPEAPGALCHDAEQMVRRRIRRQRHTDSPTATSARSPPNNFDL